MFRRIVVVLAVALAVVALVACNRGSTEQTGTSGGGTTTTTAAASPTGGEVRVGSPVNGTFGTNMTTDAEGKPYVEYTLTIAAAGNYQIDLTSTNTTVYDPYISLRQGANEVGSDDDGAGDLNSRLTQDLQPGSYTVRVTRFGSGQVTENVPFTLNVTQGAAAAPTDTAAGTAPAAGGDACSRYAACCTALSAMPGMSAMTASCAQIEQLRASPAADQACTQAMAAFAAVPNLPDACR